MIGPIHDSAAARIAAATYTNAFEFAAQSITVANGGTAGNTILNPVYEFSYKFTRPSADQINVYARTGEDGQQSVSGLGGIVVRTFDIPSRSMLSDRVEVYNDPDYCVFEHAFWDRPDGVWIYTHERLRSDPSNAAAGRICLIKSTDGKRGRSFAPPIVMPWSDYVLPLGVYPGNATGTEQYFYFGGGSPKGVRRSLVSSDGTLSAMSSPLTTASGLTEASIVAWPDGRMLAVIRLDGGGFLQQASSLDYGASWSAVSSTGIGASTGAKVTPKLLRCLNRPGRLITMFNDRGNGNRDVASSGNPAAGAFAGAWAATSFIGTPATQGNGGGVGIDVERSEYLYCCARQTGSPVVTELRWWTIRDNYLTRVQSPAPWQ